MKIRVDRSRCSGHARCAATAPDLYAIDDDGYSNLGDVEVPAGMEDPAGAGWRHAPSAPVTLEE